MVSKDQMTDIVVELMTRASIVLPGSVKNRIGAACQKENVILAKNQLETILKNIDIAETKHIPVCQDTGVPLFFVKAGKNWVNDAAVAEAITEGTAIATKKIPLRENVIHPLTKKNSGTNTGWKMPYVYYDFTQQDYTEIQVLLKGFGSEAKTSLAYIATTEDIPKATAKFVLDCCRKGFGEPCPPYIVGVGMGGTSDIAAVLAKKAFMRLPVGKKNEDPSAADLEDKLFKVVNSSGIGPMGMGGEATALAVNVELCGTHSAAVPVVVAIQCWADRQATVRIHSNGSVEFVEDK